MISPGCINKGRGIVIPKIKGSGKDAMIIKFDKNTLNIS